MAQTRVTPTRSPVASIHPGRVARARLVGEQRLPEETGRTTTPHERSNHPCGLVFLRARFPVTQSRLAWDRRQPSQIPSTIGRFRRPIGVLDADRAPVSDAQRSTNIVSGGSLAMLGGYQRSERTSVGGRV